MPVTQEAAEQLLRDNPQLLNSLHLKWTKYIPHQPTAKQMAFLMLPHQEAFYGGAAGGGKALALDTLVPTPNGWTTINDLQPADMVLGGDGKPTVVLAVSPVMRSRPVYEIEFNDGSKVVADAEHRWMTQTDAERTRAFKSTEDYRAARRARRSSRGSGKRPDLALRNMMVRKLKPAAVCGIRTTAEIAATLTVRGGRSNHTVALTDPVYLPPKTLPLDPYVLGVWLGDGTSANGGITSADPFIIRELKLAGFEPKKGVSRYRYGTRGLQSILRCLGLLNNKHVPDLYLRASLEQRLSLLQGLMDTDGNCAKDGSCEFTNTNKQLVDSVAEIVHSLGGRVVVREGNAKLNGRIVGKRWRLKFVLDFPAFRLPRKRCRQRKPTIRAKRLAIVAVRQIKSVPVKCIQVSNYDGMFLVGKAMIPTHNSDALLMAALQYVDIPGYAAVLFRKTLSDLKLPGSLLSRAHAWLGYRGDCWWNAGEHSYYFPTVDAGGNRAVPARIQFGYIGQMGGGLGSIGAKDRYQSAEFQFVGFDELTQFSQEDYTWMFNRLRKSACPIHKLDSKGRPIYMDDCWWCQTYKSLPLRMRAASNPGNAGHSWVKNRFMIVGVADEDGETKYIGTNPDAPYIPAFVQDNPFIDNEGYISNLDRMDSVTRDRLKRGDWGVSEDSRFKRQWVRYYSHYGNSYVLGSGGRGKTLSLDRDFQRIFTTVDPAASSKESPGATKIWRTGASWTVIATWGLTNDYHLLWLDNVRVQVETPDIISLLMNNYRLWRPSKIIIEASGLGKGVFQSALRAGLPAQSVHPHGDKLVRATDAMVRMEQGRVWLPEHPGPAWLEPLESELFTWTGDPMMTDDQIDVLSYAALDISWEAAAMELPLVQESYGVLTDDYRPRIIPEAKFFGSFPGIGYSDPSIDNW